MEQILTTNSLLQRSSAVPYKSVRNIPFFISALIFFSDLLIRMPPIAIGTITVGLSEPLLVVSLALMILDRWDLSRIFSTPVTTVYLLFFAFGVVDLIWSFKFFHVKAGQAFAGFRYVFIYPMALFIGYNYFSDIKHLKNFHSVIRLICICYLPLSVVYYVFHIGDHGSYLQYFDHTEAWAVSYLLFFALSRYFMRLKVNRLTIFFAVLTVIIIILTNRRGIWVSTFVSAFIVYYMSVKRISFAYISKIFLRVIVAVAILFAITRIAPDNVIVKSVEERVLVTINNLQDPTELDEGPNSIAWRLIIYNTSLNLFVQRPIFGWGLGYVQTVVFPKGEDNFHQVDDLGFHDIIMTFLVRTGIVGLILFILFHGRFVKLLLKNKNGFNDEVRPYVSALFGFYTTTVLWSLVGNELISDVNVIILCYLGMGIMLRQLVLSKNED